MEQEINSKATGNKNTKIDTRSYQIFVGVIFIIAITVGAMYYFGPGLAAPKPVATVPIAQIDPNTVLATVNGEEIIQANINERLMGAGQTLAAQGVNINDPNVRVQIESQILEDTISYTLLKQGATEAGVIVEPSALEEIFQSYVAQAGGEQQLQAQLLQAGLTEETFKERLSQQIRIDNYIGANVSVGAIEVTDKEIADFYDSAVASAGDTAPPLADVTQQISEQLRQQKQQELIAAFTASLRENATIQIN